MWRSLFSVLFISKWPMWKSPHHSVVVVVEVIITPEEEELFCRHPKDLSQSHQSALLVQTKARSWKIQRWLYKNYKLNITLINAKKENMKSNYDFFSAIILFIFQYYSLMIVFFPFFICRMLNAQLEKLRSEISDIRVQNTQLSSQVIYLKLFDIFYFLKFFYFFYSDVNIWLAIIC